MTEEVIDSRTVTGWNNTYTIQVVKDSDSIKLLETHTGPVSNTHCVAVIISLTKMNYIFMNRKHKGRKSKEYPTFFSLFKAAEEKFVLLLSNHTRQDHRKEERLTPADYKMIRKTIWDALFKHIPESELKAEKSKRKKKSVLNSLEGARLSANVNGYHHIASELARLIKEVRERADVDESARAELGSDE